MSRAVVCFIALLLSALIVILFGWWFRSSEIEVPPKNAVIATFRNPIWDEFISAPRNDLQCCSCNLELDGVFLGEEMVAGVFELDASIADDLIALFESIAEPDIKVIGRQYFAYLEFKVENREKISISLSHCHTAHNDTLTLGLLVTTRAGDVYFSTKIPSKIVANALVLEYYKSFPNRAGPMNVK